MIGGGLAGLSSAIALAEAGLRVRLLEKRPHLGGRATSYTLPDGSEVDNCQHVTLSCCTNLGDFYRRVGASGKIRFYDRLYFLDARGRRATIKASSLPPPFHMAPSFLRFGALSIEDKWWIARALLKIVRSGGRPSGIEGLSMLEWLRGLNQTPAAIERFWRIVLVSALDEELERTDARYGIDVFWKAFLGNRAGYEVGIPGVPLAQLYEGCREAVERKGGEVRVRSGARQIQVKNNCWNGAILEDGSMALADAAIVAVPHDVLPDLLPNEFFESGAPLAGLRNLRTSPIVGVHLWFDRDVMAEPFLTLIERTVQWIFNKTWLCHGPRQNGPSFGSQGAAPDAAPPQGQYLQLVISASYDLVSRSRQEIIDLCRRELAEVLPATREAQLLKATVIKEVHATFSPEPGVDRWRPGPEFGVKNLFLAGDWTQTGWPATMEGAVRSGYLSAEALLRAAGEPQKFLQPDLPAEGLCRFWSQRRSGRQQ